MKSAEFYNVNLGNVSREKMIEEIAAYVHEKPEYFYDIIVGCDSSSGDHPVFPIVVVVLRVGAGGRFFVKKVRFEVPSKQFVHPHQRIIKEVMLSCELALEVKEMLQHKIDEVAGADYQFRYIHADVGEGGQTRSMIKEVVAVINGNGFEAKIKPDSYAASVVADRFT
ncbi:MAG TPA: ribonuclease H-like YkuK family protein [Candidatus Pacearchaeota archaeon]|nr:ribonuclease H-like YkuK family protein [Candidatus Pacearchaeota archaeon]